MFPSIDVLYIFIVALVCCSVGFIQFIWFLSVGYGLSAAGVGACMLVLMFVRGQFSIPYMILCLLFIIYGFRLGGFLLIRHLTNANYRKKLREAGGEAKVPIFVSIVLWLTVGCLYFAEASGPMYRLLNNASDNIFLYIGIVICAIGILIEAIADKQKTNQKKTNPNGPAMKGLYKMCRCPNYFGEIIFWTGAVISSIGAVYGIQWIMVIVGYICIVYVMISGAKRIETRHIKSYGNSKEYNEYADHTPLLFPLIPFYHITTPEKIKAEEEKKKAKKEKNAQKKH